MSKATDAIKAELLRKAVIKPLRKADFLSTGSTLLNLACAGRWDGGFIKGKFYFLVGDSSSGKTFLSLTCLAEAARNQHFDKYRFVFDDVEGGALMSIEDFFGKRVADRMEPPARDEDGSPMFSSTIEEFYVNAADAFAAGPCIYILDSMDSLTSDAEQKVWKERRSAIRKGNQLKGVFTDGKAKANASGLRSLLAKLRDSESILIIVSQTRDNPNAGMFESKKTRSGGHSPTFYATLELHSSVGKAIKKDVGTTSPNAEDEDEDDDDDSTSKKKLQIGVISRIRVKKNRVKGYDRTVEVPIYLTLGIDDVGSCVAYLKEWGHWKHKAGKVDAVEFGFKGYEKDLIKKIETEELETDLRMLVGEVWAKIEASVAMDRKPRYE